MLVEGRNIFFILKTKLKWINNFNPSSICKFESYKYIFLNDELMKKSMHSAGNLWYVSNHWCLKKIRTYFNEIYIGCI